ncbi:MAG: hypothetical protein H0V82_00830 [Candidatus Protochlamydia sp.]|nr:hypothetical protein [Candidatus Protochlamydia sp.]
MYSYPLQPITLPKLCLDLKSISISTNSLDFGIQFESQFNFLDQKLNLSPINISLSQFLQILKDEATLLNVGAPDIFFSCLECENQQSFFPNSFEILVFLHGMPGLTLFINGVIYNLKMKGCLNSNLGGRELPLQFYKTSFDSLNGQAISIKNMNGSSISFKIFELEYNQAIPLPQSSYLTQPFEKSDSFLVPSNKSLECREEKKCLDLIIQLTADGPILLDLENIRSDFYKQLDYSKPITTQLIAQLNAAFEMTPPKNRGQVYAIVFQICAILRMGDDESKQFWKASFLLITELQLEENQGGEEDILYLVAELIVAREAPFTFILSLFQSLGYMHQWIDQPAKGAFFTNNGIKNEFLLKINFKPDTEQACYVLIESDPRKAISIMTVKSYQFSGNTQKLIISLYELLLPIFPIKDISNSKVVMTDDINKLLGEQHIWVLNHLGLMFLALDSPHSKGSFCSLLEYLPGIFSSPMTELSCSVLLKILEQSRLQYDLSNDTWEKAFEKYVSFSSNYYSWTIEYICQCTDQKILLTLKKMWLKEFGKNEFLNKDSERAGTQLLESLRKAFLMTEAIGLYQVLCRKENYQYTYRVNFLSLFCASMKNARPNSKTAVNYIRLGECTKLLIEASNCHMKINEQVSSLIYELIKLEQIALVSTILNRAEEKKIDIENFEFLKLELIHSICRSSADGADAIDAFLIQHHKMPIHGGALWLKALQFHVLLKEDLRKSLINCWVKAELNKSVIYKNISEQEKCWEIAFSLLKDLNENDVVRLYNEFKQSQSRPGNGHLAIVKETIHILYQQLPSVPEDDLLHCLINERIDLQLNTISFFLEIDMRLIILLSRSDSNKLKLKSLNLFLEWIGQHYKTALYYPFSDTLLQLFPGILQSSVNNNILQTQLINISTILRINENPKLDYFSCAEQLIRLPLPQAKLESGAMVLAGLKMIDANTKQMNPHLNIDQKLLVNTLNLLLECLFETIEPDFIIKILKNEKFCSLVHSKPVCLLWYKLLTQICKNIESSDYTNEIRIKWLKFSFVHLPKLAVDKDLIDKQFESILEMMIFSFLPKDRVIFNTLFSATLDILMPDLEDWKNDKPVRRSERSKARETIYFRLYAQLLKKSLKVLNETNEPDNIEIIYNLCTEMVLTISLFYNKLPFNFDIPFKQFCLWIPNQKHNLLLHKHVPFLITLCENASESDFFKRHPGFIPEVIPAIFDQLFGFIAAHPEEKKLVQQCYQSATPIFEFLLTKRFLHKQSFSNLMSKMILYAPLLYAFEPEEENEINTTEKNKWLFYILKAAMQQKYVSFSEGQSFRLYLTMKYTINSNSNPIEQKRDIFINLFEKFSLYPSYYSAIRCTHLLFTYYDSLLAKDYNPCFEKLFAGIKQLQSNHKTNKLLIDLCRTSCSFISLLKSKNNFQHAHALAFYLINLQMVALADPGELTPQLIFDNASEFLSDLCDEGVFEEKWKDLYAMMLFLKETAIEQNFLGVVTLLAMNFLNIIPRQSYNQLKNPEEQLQRAKFFILCALEALDSQCAVSHLLSLTDQKTEIFLNCDEIKEKYVKGL